MKRTALGLTMLAITIASWASAETRTYFGFQIGIGNAPPPPVVVFEAPPPMEYEPQTRVYVVRGDYDDHDAFRYGRYWYVCQGDYWYRARSYRGPFAVIDVRSVPRPIFYVPQRRWRHYPQGLGHWNEARQHGRGHGHGHGEGRGEGHSEHHDHD